MKQGTLVHSAGPTPSLLTGLLCGGIVETRGSLVALRARPSSWNELRPQHCMLALRLITEVSLPARLQLTRGHHDLLRCVELCNEAGWVREARMDPPSWVLSF